MSIKDVNIPLRDFPGDMPGFGSGDPRSMIEPGELNQAHSSKSELRKFVVKHSEKSDFEKAATECNEICRIWELWSDNGTVFDYAVNVTLGGKRRRKVMTQLLLLLAARGQRLARAAGA